MHLLAFSRSPSASYERLGFRVQQAIASPHVQKRQFIEITPAADESPQDWQKLLSDLEATVGVKIERLESGAIRIGWRDYTDS
ncbi:DUF1654 domain-containing protein [Pseudomonas guariconensis]|uniref:DUF1654 domain-containing protein n=1 Tax=Pseudomonas guariconensis TaxID=1288410 RepID=UPI002B052AD0|nr:DUF1654 domain-containing protein [Pseudomonas guariconensis]